MRNEMGNQNATGIREEEKAATEVSEKSQEAANQDVVNGENHIIPEVQTKDCHEKDADLSAHGFSVTTDSNAERHESDEKEQESKESEAPSRYPESANESIHWDSQENHVQKDGSVPFEANYENPPESNLEEIMPIKDKIQSNDQPFIRRETDAGEVENTNSNSEPETTFQASKTVDVTTTQLEEHHSLSTGQESEEVLKLSVSDHVEEEKYNPNEMNIEGDRDDLVLKESPCIEDKSLNMNISIEQCDIKDIEEKVQNGHGNGIELPLNENLNDISSSPTETVLEVSQIDPSSESPEPQEKHIFHGEEMNLIHGSSENPEEEPESGQAQLSELTVNELIGNVTAPMIEHEACSKDIREENMVKMSSSSDLEKVYQIEETKVIHTGTKQEQEQLRDKKIAIMMPETFSVSNGLTSIDKYDEGEKEKEKFLVEEIEKRNDDLSSTRNSRHDAGTAKDSVPNFQSLEGEIHLFPISPTSPFNMTNGPALDSPNSSFNHQWSNGLCSKAGEDWNNCTVNSSQDKNYDVFIDEESTFNEQKPSLQNQGQNVQELEQNGQEKSETEADYKHHIARETSPLPSSQESVARISIESNQDHPVTRVKLRKSPSFEFGIPLDARSEESDQTPLLVRDKSLARSLSGHANVRFQNTMIATDYGRKSLDYELVAVEEKTIRMERSDSDVSRYSFMNLLRKDEKQSIELASENKESHVGKKKEMEESSSEELALTSVKTNGKRKPRSSLFTSCICCTAAIH